MSTGARAFGGNSRAGVAAAILSSQPRPVSELEPATPPAFERLVAACMEKDPDDRLQSAHDVALQLRWIDGGEAGRREPKEARRPSKTPWLIAAMLGLLLLAGGIYHLKSRPLAAQPIRFTIEPPADSNLHRTAAISPDGRRVVALAEGTKEGPSLWLRALDSMALTPVPGTEGSQHVVWSPDGREIVFAARGALWRLAVANGNLRKVAEPVARVAGGASWSRQGVIVFSPVAEGTLLRISAAGIFPPTHPAW